MRSNGLSVQGWHPELLSPLKGFSSLVTGLQQGSPLLHTSNYSSLLILNNPLLEKYMQSICFKSKYVFSIFFLISTVPCCIVDTKEILAR